LQLLIACSTFALTVTLAVGRPRLWPGLRVSPASAAVAGTLCLMLAGTVRPGDIVTAIEALWRPLLTILAIMITTAAARDVGVIDRVAERVLAPRTGSVPALFRGVFVLSLATASLLSNDAAILLLTPLVLAFVRSRYPAEPRLLLPFAFAVFMAAGVAPFVTSNPMNMVVASYVGLDFNQYAATMLPIALAGSVLSFVLLRRVFAADLSASARPAARGTARVPFTATQIRMLALLGGVTATYPLVAMFDGGGIWPVASAGAAAAVGLASRDGRTNPARILRHGVAWDVLIFLPAVFALSIGLRNVGLVDLLASWYSDAGVGLIGATAALGSAALNNHPMALVNMLALDAGLDARPFLAALIGGDLGPRLLPTGSLAGLLWLESCRQFDVHVSPGRFMRVGIVLAIPTLALSLALLALF
jgi:arsenical pump membrane protein